MRWPADVIAYYVLDAGFTGDEAAMVVAMALAATDGDDGYRWTPSTPGGQVLVGAWAIPADGLDLAAVATASRLREAPKLLRTLRDAHDGSWDWLPAYVAADWPNRLVDAREGLRAPMAGLATPVGVMRTTMDETAGALTSAITSARASMLASAEHLRRQV